MEKREAGFYIKKIHDHMRCEANHDLKELDLTFSQMEILSFLMEREGLRTNHRDIEHFFQLRHPTVIGLLKRLEHKGFVETAIDPDDRRSRIIAATDKAYEIGRHMAMRKDAAEERLKNCIPADKQEEFLDLLEMMYATFCMTEKEKLEVEKSYGTDNQKRTRK